MWWKRILYYLLIIVLGVGITILSGSIAFNALSINLVEKANKENDYTTIENYFNYITVPNDSKFVKEDVNDVHVEIYPSIVTQPYYKKNLDGSYSVKYDIVEEAICFSFFHLPKDYKYNGNNSRISLFLDNSNTIDLMFNNLNADESAINYHINFVSYVELYYSFNIYITYNDFISHGGSDSSSITGFKMFDGNNNQTLEMTVSTPFGFISDFHNDFHEACQNYREYILLYGEAHSVTTYERKYTLKDKIDEIAINNPDKYLKQPSTNTVLNTTPFILTISLVASIYISIAIVVSWNIFHRKKSY